MIERSLEIRKKVLEDPDHLHVMQAQMSLATLRDAQGRLDEAVQLHREVLEKRLSVLEDSNLGVARSRSALASSLHHRGKPEDLLEAEGLFRTALESFLQSRDAGPEHASTWVVQRNLAELWISTGRPQEAEMLLRELTARAQQWGPADRWRAADVRSLLGASLMAQGRWGEAEPLIEGAWQVIKEHRGAESRFARLAHERLSQ